MKKYQSTWQKWSTNKEINSIIVIFDNYVQETVSRQQVCTRERIQKRSKQLQRTSISELTAKEQLHSYKRITDASNVGMSQRLEI